MSESLLKVLYSMGCELATQAPEPNNKGEAWSEMTVTDISRIFGAMAKQMGIDCVGDHAREWLAEFARTLAFLYSRDQFERLLKYRTPDGECLTLAHLHSLMGVHSVVQRDEMARLAAEEDWSVDELNKRVMELIELVMEDVDYCLYHATK